MPKIEHIFLDDGGVINDNTRRAPQWQRLVGEFFPSRLGGTAAQWSEANAATFPDVFDRFSTRIAPWDSATSDYAREIDINNVDWLQSMCSWIGVAAPEPDEACLSLAQEATRYIMARVRADYPGAVDTVRWLTDRYALRTASNGGSFELEMIYEPLGIQSCFLTLYGPDLVGQPKTSARFYDLIFEHAGVDPATALVLDDNPSCIGWAREAGAQAVLVGASDKAEGTRSIPALRDLPALLADGW
jgi:HAD superfamily hydrolase (TIGR01509 family)